MDSIIVEFPNRDIINISLNDYEVNDNYKKYLDIVKNKLVAKELYVIDNILSDKNYWEHNKKIYHINIFNKPTKYTIKGLNSYKNMLLNANDML